VLNFEGFEANFFNDSSQAFAGFTVSETNEANAGKLLYQLRNFGLEGLSNAFTEGTGAIGLTEQPTSKANFSFHSAINAFGIDITASRAGTMTVGGDVSTTITVADANSPFFFGVIDFSGTFSNITFAHDFSKPQATVNVGWDAADYGLISAVPEPSALAMWGLVGVIGLMIARRPRCIVVA